MAYLEWATWGGENCMPQVLMAVVLHQQAELSFATIVGKASVHLPPGSTTEGAHTVRTNRHDLLLTMVSARHAECNSTRGNGLRVT